MNGAQIVERKSASEDWLGTVEFTRSAFAGHASVDERPAEPVRNERKEQRPQGGL